MSSLNTRNYLYRHRVIFFKINMVIWEAAEPQKIMRAVSENESTEVTFEWTHRAPFLVSARVL
jgi:hypothetical protein